MSGPRAELAERLAGLMPSLREDLDALVRIPSVSADPSATEAMTASAEAVADLLRGAGMPQVEIIGADGGQPAVVGRHLAPEGAPTVLLYAHHDVQPAGALLDWDTDPFVPVEVGGRLYGRGAADDKAGIAVHLAALRLLGSSPPVGVTVLVEGEEEIGSPTLPALMEAHRELLAADVIVLADSTNWRVGVPALTTSLRGGVGVTVEVATLEHAVHNGLYGGAVPDALTALSRLLATLHDEDGAVAVAGLAHGTPTASSPELGAEQLRADAGVLEGVRLTGTGPIASRLWTSPAICVVGIDAPAVDSAPMTVVPRARAKIALRIAPSDDAEAARDALVRHLRTHAPWGARVTVTAGQPVRPFAATTTGPAYAAARRAFEEAWQVPPVDIGVGGSINFISTFAATFPDAEILVTGVEDPDTRAHGANESLHLGDFEKACLAEALLLRRLAPSS